MDGDIVKTGEGAEADARIATCASTGRDELNLASLRLELMPGDIFGIAGFLRTLNLRGNRIEYLPKTVNLLQQLEILDLSSCGLRALPESVGELESLTKLQVQHNKLKTLPLSLGNLAALVELDVSRNRLEALCEELGNLVRLERLDVSNNNIDHIADGIDTTSLPNLRIVNFSGNPVVQRLPWSLQCLQDLFPLLTSKEERRRLVKRNLKTKQRVNEKMLL